MEWCHVCWPGLTAKRFEPVVSISWASCFTCWMPFLSPNATNSVRALGEKLSTTNGIINPGNLVSHSFFLQFKPNFRTPSLEMVSVIFVWTMHHLLEQVSIHTLQCECWQQLRTSICWHSHSRLHNVPSQSVQTSHRIQFPSVCDQICCYIGPNNETDHHNHQMATVTA